jgi:hypothetical protein
MSAYSLATALRISARKGFRLSIFGLESVETNFALSNPCVSPEPEIDGHEDRYVGQAVR